MVMILMMTMMMMTWADGRLCSLEPPALRGIMAAAYGDELALEKGHRLLTLLLFMAVMMTTNDDFDDDENCTIIPMSLKLVQLTSQAALLNVLM